MRTVLLLLGTMVLLLGGFAVYWYMQPADISRSAAPVATTQRAAKPVQDGETTYTVRGASNVWLKEFDETRRLTNQFRAAEFHPQKEGFVRVSRPEAHFFLKGGQWIRVIGEDGDVVVSGLPEGGENPFAGGAGAQGTPSRGRLRNVRIQFYETAADGASPTLDMEMNN